MPSAAVRGFASRIAITVATCGLAAAAAGPVRAASPVKIDLRLGMSQQYVSLAAGPGHLRLANPTAAGAREAVITGPVAKRLSGSEDTEVRARFERRTRETPHVLTHLSWTMSPVHEGGLVSGMESKVRKRVEHGGALCLVLHNGEVLALRDAAGSAGAREAVLEPSRRSAMAWVFGQRGRPSPNVAEICPASAQ